MRVWRHRLSGTALALALLVVAFVPAVRADAGFETVPVVGGVFYPVVGADGLGYAVRNYADGPGFMDAYRRFGGDQLLGPPVSRPWTTEAGAIFQLTQRAMLRWTPADGTVQLASVFERLQGVGHERILLRYQVPPPEPNGPPASLAPDSPRLGWLTDAAIAAAFANNPIKPDDLTVSLAFFGQPMSRPVAFGPVVVQRFQRVALRHWAHDVIGGLPVGTVEFVNAGDIYKDLALPHPLIGVPRAPDDATVLDVSVDPPVLADLIPAPSDLRTYATQDPVLLAAIALAETVPENAPALELADALDVRLAFRPMSSRAFGGFGAALGIRINRSLRNLDTRAIAAVLAHELAHFEDVTNGVAFEGVAGCLAAETHAITKEAQTWLALVGPAGLHPASNVLVRVLNARVGALQSGPDGIQRLTERTYRRACRARNR